MARQWIHKSNAYNWVSSFNCTTKYGGSTSPATYGPLPATGDVTHRMSAYFCVITQANSNATIAITLSGAGPTVCSFNMTIAQIPNSAV